MRVKKELLGGGYDTIKEQGERGQRIYNDFHDMIVAGNFVASTLKHGIESIFDDEKDVEKLKNEEEKRISW